MKIDGLIKNSLSKIIVKAVSLIYGKKDLNVKIEDIEKLEEDLDKVKSDLQNED